MPESIGKRLYYCDCDAQYAAGGPCQRQNGFLLYGRDGRIRSDQEDIHKSGERGYAELYYRSLRIERSPLPVLETEY